MMNAAAALRREESRGGHYRADFPKADARQAQRTFLTLGEARRIAETVDMPIAPELAPA